MRVSGNRLANIAKSQVLWLVGGRGFFMQRGVAAIKRHPETQEAGRRYKSGWIIGGHATPVHNEILRLGGVWLPHHKAWTMPDRESWQQIQDLLPGNFGPNS